MSLMRARVYQVVDAFKMPMTMDKDNKVKGEQTFSLPNTGLVFHLRVMKTLDFGAASTTLVFALSVKDSQSTSDMVMVADSCTGTNHNNWLAVTLISLSKLDGDFKWEDFTEVDQLYKALKPATVASFTLNNEKWEAAA